tara:strand:+ start:21481 stop:21612 length:132 start_codon:yes stop_codon:yes gene_type:complete
LHDRRLVSAIATNAAGTAVVTIPIPSNPAKLLTSNGVMGTLGT